MKNRELRNELDQAVGLGRGLLHHQADRDVAEVERDAEAEDEEQQQRQDAGDQVAARVAGDLQPFLPHQPGDPT